MKTKIRIAMVSFLWLLVVSFSQCGAEEATFPVKVILDCDMGYMNDDALSLSMLVRAEEMGLVEILGITLEGGNNFIDAPYENGGETCRGCAECTRELLKKLDREDIPYFRGTDFPVGFDRENTAELEAFYQGLDYIKFNDGYGAIHFFGTVDRDALCDKNDATDFLVRTVREYPDEVVILAIGPVMNIARAVEQDDAFAQHVKAIYYMGGALGGEVGMETANGDKVIGIDGANVTPVTEYNVLYDPVSFGICLTAGFPTQYILPGSCSVGIDAAIAERMISCSDGSAVACLWAEHYKSYIQDYPYWDPMTVYALLCPEAIEESDIEYVTVGTERYADAFGRMDGYSEAAYGQLSGEWQEMCGKAQVIYSMAGFWDYTTALLCQ